MRNVTVRQLQVFVDAAETLSFARVAERLHLTPAGVSFQIKQIETQSGFALFERVGRRVALTDAGKSLLVYARQVLRSLHDADQAMMALKGLSGGQVTIGLVSTAKYIAPHMLARFRADYPAIAINLRDGNRQWVNEALVKGEIDLAIMGKPLDGTDVVVEPFASHPSVIAAAPDHPLAGLRHLPVSVLAREPMVVREEGSGTRSLLARFVEHAGVRLKVALTTSSNETIKQAVMAGMGIALISRHTIGLELGLGMMTTLAVEGFPLMRSWFVAHRRNMPLLPVHARLRGFLLENGQAIIDDLDREHRRIGDLAKRGVERARSRPQRKARPRRQ
ncbi:MAG TPA: LysR substrate-binding domain-containing protein [Stellaceae bacterium]|nr:LysR substrate-binding domain-containing protein [Stellaceae bacterium]